MVNVNVMLAEETKVDGGGVPYATAFGVFGAAVTLLLAFTTYLMARRWNTRLFCRALRLTLWVGIACAWLCSVWFIVVTDLFNHFGVLGVLLASAGRAFGIKVARLVEASATR